MTRTPSHPIARRFAVVVVLVVAALGVSPGLARAQDDPDIVDDGPPVPANRAEVEDFMVHESTFDQWVFGNMMQGGNASSVRVRIETSLDNQITALNNLVPIGEAQKKKLKLAGRGDIKRFFDQVEEKRAKFNLVRKDRNKFGNFYQEIIPLQSAVNRGLFREDSLFFKTLLSTLDAEQAARYSKFEEERRRFRWRARVELVTEMWGSTLGLNAQQRRQLVDLVLSEVPTPKALGQQDNYFVLYKLASVPRDKLQPLFNASQWKVFDRQILQAKAYRSMLEQQGYDREDLVVATVKPGAKEAKNQ